MNNLNTCNDSQLKDCELLDKYHDSGYNKLIMTDWGYIVKLAVYGYGFVNISFNKAEREQMVKVFSGDFNIPVSITKDGKNLKYNSSSNITLSVKSFWSVVSQWGREGYTTLYKYAKNHGSHYKLFSDNGDKYIMKGKYGIEKIKK